MLWHKFSAWLWVNWLGFGDLFACVCLNVGCAGLVCVGVLSDFGVLGFWFCGFSGADCVVLVGVVVGFGLCYFVYWCCGWWVSRACCFVNVWRSFSGFWLCVDDFGFWVF